MKTKRHSLTPTNHAARLPSPAGVSPLLACGWLLASAVAATLLSRAADVPTCPSFGPPTGFPVGANPSASVAVGDFSGDGRLDVAVANAQRTSGTPGNVSVLLGNGDGTFQTCVNYAAGKEPFSVAAADLNGDGKLDLAVPNSWGDNLSVFLGEGDGTFRPAVYYPTAAHPLFLAVGNFDGDQHPDLAVVTQWAGQVSILLGNGDGTFRAPVNYPAGDWPQHVVRGDFDRDGRLDVATANTPSDNVSVLLGNGDGTFKPAVRYPVGDSPVGLAVGDLNGDGRPDLISANNYARSVSMLFGQGDGTFAAAVEYPVGQGGAVQKVAVADFNLDGLLDVAVGDTGDNTIVVLMGKGGGLFETQVSFPGGQQPWGIATGDFNGDGVPDLVAAASAADSVVVLLNRCPPPLAVTAPANQIGCVGGSASFSVTARGVGLLSYEWYFNGVGLTGQTTPILTLTNLQRSQAGRYWVVVTDSSGSVTSVPATLIIGDACVDIRTYAGLTIAGEAGRTYELRYTTNLLDTDLSTWTLLATQVMGASPWFYLDPDTPVGQKRFYGVRVLP